MEKTADFNLKNQNFEPFFPRILFRKGKKCWEEPMFRGYGFVRFNPALVVWSSINGTRGVVGLLPRLSLYPTPAPEGFVEQLKENDPMPDDRFVEVFDQYFPGVTEVVVDESHRLLGGRKGLVVDIRSKLLLVSFTQEGRGTPVWLDKSEVSVA